MLSVGAFVETGATEHCHLSQSLFGEAHGEDGVDVLAQMVVLAD